MPHPTDKLYPYQAPATSGPWILKRDGVEIITGTEQDCWTWLHSHCSCSVDWALKYEGYSITPGKVGP